MRVGHLFLYPVKSLDGLEVSRAALTSRGPFEHDRAWTIVDAAGEVVTGKREAALHAIRTSFDLERGRMTIDGVEAAPGEARADDILSQRLGRSVRLVRVDGGAPDHRRMPGPSVIARETLALFAEWFGWSGWEEARRRFRANIIVEDAPPFWEDRLIGRFLRAVEFSVGAARLRAVMPCARCVVPSRDSMTGSAAAGFQKSFVEKRRESFPEWGTKSAFPHFYHAAVLTRVSHVAEICAGDEVRIEGERLIDADLRLVARASLARLRGLRGK